MILHTHRNFLLCTFDSYAIGSFYGSCCNPGNSQRLIQLEVIVIKGEIMVKRGKVIKGSQREIDPMKMKKPSPTLFRLRCEKLSFRKTGATA